jgi:hypothetical protein
MSLDFIYTFQLQILETLKKLVGEYVNQIYISVTQDGNYPFILINFIKADNYSNPMQAVYLLEFEICIFSREHNKKRLLNISDLVLSLLSADTLKIPRYNVAGLKLNDLFFDEARDLVHNKLTMSYKTIIKKEVLNELS